MMDAISWYLLNSKSSVLVDTYHKRTEDPVMFAIVGPLDKDAVLKRLSSFNLETSADPRYDFIWNATSSEVLDASRKLDEHFRENVPVPIPRERK